MAHHSRCFYFLELLARPVADPILLIGFLLEILVLFYFLFFCFGDKDRLFLYLFIFLEMIGIDWFVNLFI